MKTKLNGAALAVVAAFASPPPANAADVAGVFSQGRTHFVVSGGTGYAFDETYLVLGLGVSYYVIDGLNVGLTIESWSGSDPRLVKVTPSAQYVFHRVPVLKPYVGGFYRRTYVEGRSDLDSFGGRAGVYLEAGRNAYLGVGAVYESYADCSSSVYRSCSSTYPEVSFTVAF
jgi:hypothetical protein